MKAFLDVSYKRSRYAYRTNRPKIVVVTKKIAKAYFCHKKMTENSVQYRLTF